MTKNQVYRKPSQLGVKHIALSEQSIMTFLRLSEPIDMDKIDRLIIGITETNFDSIKLMLYEKQENYTKCLQLLIESQTISTFCDAKIKDRFSWIIHTYFMLDAR